MKEQLINKVEFVVNSFSFIPSVCFHNLNQQRTMEDKSKIPQIGYYYSLRRYKPMWYSDKGVPFLLIHDMYSSSIPCILFIDAIFILIITMLSLFHEKPAQQDFKSVVVKLSILVFVFLNVSYFLTVFMNPGIVSEQHMQAQVDQIKFCQRCHRRTANMQHCIQCEVCVEQLDHHCAFFGKCIAGKQRFAFYGFLTFMFAAFIVLLTAISLTMN